MPESDFSALFKKVTDVGAAQGKPIAIENGVPVVLVPDGYKLQSLESQIYNEHAAHPERKVANVIVLEPESFLDYWRQFCNDDSQAFADPDTNKIIASLDYHRTMDGPARWRKHWLTLIMKLTDEWVEWSGENKKAKNQMEFAEFLEDHAPDIVNPNAATFIEAARDLKAKNDVEFASKVEMKDGSVQFAYNENVKGTYGKGAVEIPERFDISIPIYLGTAPVTISVRLRFRINSGKLTMWYDMYRASYMQREAFQRVVEDISAGVEKKVFIGRP